jgi:GNAT superfamily N-acetyltransferase
MVIYYETFSTWKGRMLYLEDFYVKETARRFGVGQKLFNAFHETAREKDCKITKWQVLDWNIPAVKFYKKNNAIIEKEWWNVKIFLE